MGVHILRSNTKVAQCGPVRMWAERGIICFEDSRDNGFTQCDVREALYRVKAVHDMIGNTVSKGIARDADEAEKLQRFVDEAVDIIRLAKEQGSPNDPTARNSLKAARPKSVAMSNTFDGFKF